MTFYKPEGSTFTRHYAEEVAMVLSGMDCILHQHGAVYCSSEMTTGLRLYQVLHERGLSSAGELKAQLGDTRYREEIFETNCRLAISFAEEVRHRFSDRTLIITPAPFAAQGWSQPEYLAFWETLIRTRITAVWLNRNWQYSNGCTFEFAVAVDAGLPVYDSTGALLPKIVGVDLIRSAIRDLEHMGFTPDRLHENLAFCG